MPLSPEERQRLIDQGGSNRDIIGRLSRAEKAKDQYLAENGGNQNLGTANSSGPGGMAPVAMSPQDAANQAAQNDQKAVPDGTGGWKFVPLMGAELAENQRRRNEAAGAAGPPQPTIPTDPMANRVPAGPLTPQQAVSQYGSSVAGFESAFTPGPRQNTTGRVARAPGVIDGVGASGGAPPAEQAPAEVDRARIDALLGNVSKANSGLMGLADRDLEFSQAQAQLRQGLDQGQRQSLALARSGSRRDRAANEARAIQGNTELAAQTGQAAAGLRAQEEAAQQQIKLDAYKAAGDLGLNAGALDLNAQNLDMNAATNFLNQMFARENLGMQIDQQEAERVTNFVRDMALLDRDYYSLSQQERDAVRQDLTRRYGISETTRLGLEQLEKNGEVNWTQVGATMAVATIGAVADVYTSGATKPVTSQLTSATSQATA